MMEFIVPFIVGVVLIALGISNMRGNISSLHSYHRHRVSEEDRIPFGKQVGLGTVIIGVGIIIFSILSAITLYTENNIFVLIGTAVLIVGIIVGLVLSFKAMIKYNKGIFWWIQFIERYTYMKKKKLLFAILCALGSGTVGFFANQLTEVYGCVLFGIGVGIMVYSIINLSKWIIYWTDNKIQIFLRENLWKTNV